VADAKVDPKIGHPDLNVNLVSSRFEPFEHFVFERTIEVATGGGAGSAPPPFGVFDVALEHVHAALARLDRSDVGRGHGREEPDSPARAGKEPYGQNIGPRLFLLDREFDLK
jgi:hypothetical protein